MSGHNVRIEVINEKSPHLAVVKHLGDANSKTLGFLPNAAFNAAAANGTVLAAILDGVCVGYLLYRIARGRASITHLCVDPSKRRRGIARQLVNTLVEKTHQLAGVGLWCRRDYDTSKVWQRVGFAAMAEKAGRSKEGSELTFWWMDHHQPTLFTRTDVKQEDARISVVIDACVFFDQIDETSADTVESKSLQADWLCNSIELYVTDETFNEIDRGRDVQQRKRHRALAQGFPQAQYDATRFQQVRESLRHGFPSKATASDESDLNQLAKTIAADIPFFVTRAQDILDKADAVYDSYGLTIVRPADLIIELDQLRREGEYRPRRVAGSLRNIQLVKGGQEDVLASYFQCDALGESRQHFIRELTAALSSPTTSKCYTVSDESRDLLALVVHGSDEKGILQVPLLRVARGSSAPTMARYLAQYTILTASKEDRPLVVVADACIDPVVADALREGSFVHEQGRWARAVLNASDSKADVVRQLESLHNAFAGRTELFAEASKNLRRTPLSDTKMLAEFEALLWPAKITDAGIPSFIIPIQPRWAQHLFDEHLANQQLFGARADLALNCEAVYYRTKSRCGLTTPARILWYVSQDNEFSGAGSIRAFSRLDEIHVGKPKELYRRFRRLGVYEWRDVFQLAKTDVDNEIMALRFSNTALLAKPIPWHDMQKLLTAEGIRSQIQTATQIPSRLFATLYTRGTH
jgi:GNAT superfamily N-acetyltransferase